MNKLKVVSWLITIMLHVLLMSYSNASNQDKSDVDSELSRIVNLPIPSLEDSQKLVVSEQARVQSLGEVKVTKIKTLEAHAAKLSQGREDIDWKKRIDLYQQIIAIDPNNWEVLEVLAMGYTLAGDSDKGLEYSLKALKRLRVSDEYMFVAAAYARKGDKDKALLWLKKAYDGGYTFRSANSLELWFPKYLKYQDDPKFKAITARTSELLKRCEPYANFSKKYADAKWVYDLKALVANPFIYEGKTVKLFLYFAEMETATTAIFNNNNGGSSMPVALFDGVPRGLYTQEVRVLVVGRVIGKTTKKFSGFDFPLVHLKYIEAFKEPPSGCSG